MKFSIVSIFLLSIATLSFSQDFKGLEWGISQDDVVNKEQGDVSRLGSRLVYLKQLGGLDAELVYFFDEGRLFSAEYHIRHNFKSLNDYILHFNIFRKLLTEKYGDPFSTDVQWKDDKYRDDPIKYGEAIAKGSLILTTTWRTENTIIKLSCQKGNEGEVALNIKYRSSELTSLISPKEEESVLEQL